MLAVLATVTVADAQPAPSSAPHGETAASASAQAAQGVAVVGGVAVRDEAFTLARAVYASSLRPRRLDELRARILAGDPTPPAATKEIRELAELRAGVSGEDAASRRLLASIAQQLGVQALLVVSRAPVESTPAPAGSAPAESAPAGSEPAPAASDATPAAQDGGAPTATPSEAPTAEAPGARPAAEPPRIRARLFLAASGEFDAARYEPDELGWRGTVTSLSGRFPPPRSATPATAQLKTPPPKLPSDGKESQPFYRSPWLWGAVGAAVLIGGFFFFATQDTSDDPIHLQMRVPR
ncbi:MAG: hypothetical protein KF850_38580 [Labilithrix sp.]|nr:hypothetical protein [Labilithrix sp.]